MPRTVRAALVALMVAAGPAGAQDTRRPGGGCDPETGLCRGDPGGSDSLGYPEDGTAARRDPGRRYDRERDRGGIGAGGILAIVGGLVAAAVAADALTGDGWASDEELLRDGPRFPRRQGFGTFQAQGYAAPGWPVAVDYLDEPGTQAWLEVRLRDEDKDAVPRIALTRGADGVAVARLPMTRALNRVRRARYTVVSLDAREKRSPLVVRGIAAGPRAVGSITIAVERFGPPRVARPEGVGFSISARRPFDRAATEVLRLPPREGKELTLVRDQRSAPFAPGRHPGTWGAMAPRAAEGPGRYILQTRAWLVGARGDDKDWTGAFGPAPVEVR